MHDLAPDPPGSPPYLEGFMRDPITGEMPKRLSDIEMQKKVAEFEKNRPAGWPNYTVDDEPPALKRAKERYVKKHGKLRVQP